MLYVTFVFMVAKLWAQCIWDILSDTAFYCCAQYASYSFRTSSGRMLVLFSFAALGIFSSGIALLIHK